MQERRPSLFADIARWLANGHPSVGVAVRRTLTELATMRHDYRIGEKALFKHRDSPLLLMQDIRPAPQPGHDPQYWWAQVRLSGRGTFRRVSRFRRDDIVDHCFPGVPWTHPYHEVPTQHLFDLAQCTFVPDINGNLG